MIDTLPLSVRERQLRFSTCDVCRRVFWEGSHWRHMRERLATVVTPAGKDTMEKQQRTARCNTEPPADQQ